LSSAVEEAVKRLVASRLCDSIARTRARVESRISEIPDSDLRKAYYLQALANLKAMEREACGGE